MFEFIFEFILEGISEISQRFEIHPILKIVISIALILIFSAFFIWLMIKIGVWE